MTHRIVNERGLVGDFFCADSKTPRPTVLLLGGSEGGKSWSDTPEAVGLLAPLVGQGSNVLSLAYFGTEGLPFVPYSASAVDALMEDVQTGQFLETYTRMLQDEQAAAQAAIPVEDTQGALLLISGTRDAMWPSTLMCERMTARLSEAGFRFPYEHVALGAGHNVVEHGDFWPTVTGFLGREAGGRGTSG